MLLDVNKVMSQNATLIEELFRLKMLDNMNSGHQFFEILFGILLLILGFCVALQLFEKRKYNHFIANGIPIFYWSLFTLNYFFRSGSNDFICCMRLGRPQLNGFLFLLLLLGIAILIFMTLKAVYRKVRRVSVALLSFWCTSVLLTLLCNCFVL